MTTKTAELKFRALFLVLAFSLVGCQQEEFFEKELAPVTPGSSVDSDNPNPGNPATSGGSEGGSGSEPSLIPIPGGQTSGGSVGGSSGDTSGGSTSAGSTTGGSTGDSTTGGSTGGSSTGSTTGGSTGSTTGGSNTQPPVEQPPVVQPPVEQPPVVQPPVEQPPVVQPPVEQPPVVQPPVVQPPVVQPPVVQPPVEQPPVVQPPVVQPPVVQPPVVQPPVEQPPVVQPPVVQPPIGIIQPPMERNHEDSFSQLDDSDKKIDILWVMDNSGSMKPFQDALARNFRVFINDFIHRKIDFKMAITNTDCSSASKCGAPVPGSLESLTAVQANGNPQAFISTFQNHIRVGTNGSGRERGLQAAEAFLDKHAHRAFRNDSRLAIVFVSDEEDQSVKSAQEYLNRYLEEKSLLGSDYVRAYSIVNKGSCRNGNGILCGYDRYAYQSDRTNGIIADMNGNFAPILAEMGSDLQNLLDSFTLTHTPIAGSVVVKVNGVVTQEWTLQGRNLKFNNGHIPAVGSNISVSYKY
jgi:hypothetical protein